MLQLQVVGACLREDLNSTRIGVEGGNRRQRNKHLVASARCFPVYNDLKIITEG